MQWLSYAIPITRIKKKILGLLDNLVKWSSIYTLHWTIVLLGLVINCTLNLIANNCCQLLAFIKIAYKSNNSGMSSAVNTLKSKNIFGSFQFQKYL